MSTPSQPPWATGPGEILRHGLELLQTDTDTNRRLAMISIDNAVELMIKTYLGLPKRITGLTITRREFQEMSESFPALLDGLEKYASEKINGIDLGSIEWYHRLRNELYHQGNGLTVERQKVEIYAELANLLFFNLYGYSLVPKISDNADILGEFISSWIYLERSLRLLAEKHSFMNHSPRGMIDVIRFLSDSGLISENEVNRINAIRVMRNSVVHGVISPETVVTKEVIDEISKLSKSIADAAE